MEMDKNGFDLLKSFESFSSKPYLDIARIPTNGWGFTFYPNGKKVTMKDAPISEKEADIILEQIFKKNFAPSIPNNLNQNQSNAIGCLIYNIGSTNFNKSTLLKKIKVNPNDPSIKDEFLKWNKITKDGKLVAVNGLTNRRNKEQELYFK